MIAPLVPYAIKGAIWYQGESNAGRAYQYRTLFPAMIKDWRTQWKQDFPFLFVQLANFMKTTEQPAESDWAELREAQSMSLSLPKTGMAVIIDVGDANDIHPRNKQDVGKRLALAAQKVAYNENTVYSGPTYKSMKKEGSKIIVTFDNVGGGLLAKGGELKEFAIAGPDKKFVWANARIEGNTVVVSSEGLQNPVAVRYAWANNPDKANLYNKEGLPASPFRTDDWPGLTISRK
jgi:sialate O-acetylesterase